MNWYQIIDGNEPITQGDLLFNCPIVKADPNSIIKMFAAQADEELEIPVIIETYNVVVLTQACDLVSDPSTGRYPVKDVLVAVLSDVNEIDTGKSKRKDFITKIHAGNIPNLHLISRYEGDDSIKEMNYQIVDFSAVFTIPYDVLMTFREIHGKRLRLNTPHRESLNHRYGSYIARVGLPDEDFIKRQDVIDSLKTN